MFKRHYKGILINYKGIYRIKYKLNHLNLYTIILTKILNIFILKGNISIR